MSRLQHPHPAGMEGSHHYHVGEATSVQAGEGRIAFRVRLGEIGELFEAPEADPFEDQLRVTSGIDDIVANLAVRRWKPPTTFEATLVVPASEMADDLQERAAAAVRRYSRHKLDEAAEEEARARYEGYAKTPFALVCSIIAGVLFAGLHLAPFISDDVALLLTPLPMLLLWVAAWHPVEVIFYDRWQPQRDQEIYRAVEAMTITVEAEPA